MHARIGLAHLLTFVAHAGRFLLVRRERRGRARRLGACGRLGLLALAQRLGEGRCLDRPLFEACLEGVSLRLERLKLRAPLLFRIQQRVLERAQLRLGTLAIGLGLAGHHTLLREGLAHLLLLLQPLLEARLCRLELRHLGLARRLERECRVA